jgi:ribosomal protein L11 methyltransferase
LDKAWPALDIHVPGCDPQLLELVLAEVDDFQPSAIQESDDASKLRVFFATPQSRQDAARALAATFGSHVFVEPLDVPDQDWAARSQAQLRAVEVGRLVIAPPWDTYQKRGQTPLLVVIRPSMGFGTGHHATTRLMLQALQALPLEGRTVLDIGCGSGVLAIAAARLGASDARGIDTDPDAVSSARENQRLNRDIAHVRFDEIDLLHIDSRFGVVLANLTGSLLERSAAKLAQLVAPEGQLVISGFMDSERGPVLSALERFLTLEHVRQEDEWLCAVLAYRSLHA